MKKTKPIYWYSCMAAAFVLTIIAFTPLVIPMGVYQPMIGGIPRTLWAGILVYFCFVLVTYLATRAHPKNVINRGEDK